MPDDAVHEMATSGETVAHMSDADTLVWYVAYGSNLRWSRFRCYLAGGRPDGSSHTNVGARNPADPLSVEPVNILGRVLFSNHSTVWGGGIAFFDPAATDLVAGRAYLITLEQFNDVVVQENGFSAGIDLALRPVLSGVELTLPDAWYGTVLRVGTMAARIPRLGPTTHRRLSRDARRRDGALDGPADRDVGRTGCGAYWPGTVTRLLTTAAGCAQPGGRHAA